MSGSGAWGLLGDGLPPALRLGLEDPPSQGAREGTWSSIPVLSKQSSSEAWGSPEVPKGPLWGKSEARE